MYFNECANFSILKARNFMNMIFKIYNKSSEKLDDTTPKKLVDITPKEVVYTPLEDD